MGKKLENSEIVGLIRDSPQTATFDYCYRCSGIEVGGSMQSKDPDDNSADLICNECSQTLVMNREADWRMNRDSGNGNTPQFRLGNLKVIGPINALKETVMDLGASFENCEPPSYITDFMFAVESEYQAYWGLDQDCFDKVHEDYEVYKNAPKVTELRG
mgnify:CR=1 FL=1|tara:strand:+ start:1171 stop:1647 length:477 start_codon:yes stop_codon:yes gene_type:complete